MDRAVFPPGRFRFHGRVGRCRTDAESHGTPSGGRLATGDGGAGAASSARDGHAPRDGTVAQPATVVQEPFPRALLLQHHIAQHARRGGVSHVRHEQLPGLQLHGESLVRYGAWVMLFGERDLL